MFAGGCSELGLVGNPKGRKYKSVIKLRKESLGRMFIKERELEGGDIEWAAGTLHAGRRYPTRSEVSVGGPYVKATATSHTLSSLSSCHSNSVLVCVLLSQFCSFIFSSTIHFSYPPPFSKSFPSCSVCMHVDCRLLIAPIFI